MSDIITFDVPGADGQQVYNEDIFKFTNGSLGFDRAVDPNPANGNYVVPIESNATVTVESTNGDLFGLQSISFDGFKNDTTVDGVRTGYGAVVITFHAFSAVLNQELPPFSLTTDSAAGFETFTATSLQFIPEAYRSGLAFLYWVTTPAPGSGSNNAFAAVDNVVLTTNTAPTTDGTISTTVQADGSIDGVLAGFDADGDVLTFSQTTSVAGVSVYSDGAFSVDRTQADDDLLPGQFRSVTFSYVVTDGAETSDGRTVTVQIFGLPQGPDIRGGNHPQTLCGTEAGERIFGGNQHDTLCGEGGADTLSGDNGNDVLDGENGRDRLLGGNGRDTMDGGAGNDVLDGGNSSDKLTGGFGDDTMTGGNSPDEFYLGPGWGHDVITDFDPKNEHIHIVPSPTLGSWYDLQHSMTQVGADVLIDDHAGNTLLLQNMKLSSLKADDFLFG